MGPTMGKRAQNGPCIRPNIDPTWAQMDPTGPNMGPKMDPRWVHKGPYGALMGPKVSVEQTLIADSPRPTFMTKTNEKVPCI
jgi:hypothetical protein